MNIVHRSRRDGWLRLRPWRRHSLVLLVAGVTYVLIGFAYLLTPSNPAREEALVLPLSLTAGSTLPWCFLFAAVGALAILSARWPPASETWGYTALTGLSTIWACFYIGGMGINIWVEHVPVDKALNSSTGALLFAVLGFLWWAISGLRNPDDLPAPARGGPAPGGQGV